MLKHKAIKFSITAFLVVMALWIAVPKVYIHQLFHHSHAAITIGDETTVQSQQSTDDCEFEKYNKPVYFNIFKFVSKIAPVKPKNAIFAPENTLHFPGVSFLRSFLRGPPATE